MFCQNCGKPLDDDLRFCTNCGTPVPSSQEPAPVPPMPIPPTQNFQAPAAPVATAVAPEKKKNKGLIIGIAIAVAATLLITGILLGIFLSGDDEGEDTQPSSSSTAATEPSSKPSTPPPTDKPTVDLVVKEAELTYEMTDADVDKFYLLLEQCKKAALDGKDGDTVMAAYEKMEDQFDYMDTQLSIATVLYYSDLNNESASQLVLDCTDIINQAQDDYLEMAKELYKAEFPAKERFFEDWTEQDIAMLLSHTSEVTELTNRNSEIEVAYQDLQDDPDMYTKMVPLYIEMVQNNNRIAQIYGYDNYYEYAYAMVYDRDYGSKEINAMRDYVSEYLPGAAENALNNFTESVNSLGYFQQGQLSRFLFNSFTPGYTTELENYLATLPEQTRKDMLDMFNGNIILADSTAGAMEGAFTTTIGEDRMICFFGPDYSNTLTVVHEVGHYYGGQHTVLDSLPLDLAETQSQGNEWLFMGYMENEMSEKVYNTTVDYKMYSDIVTIMLCVIIDEFEERVYTHPNIASLTCDDLDAIMEDVCSRYGGIDFLGEIATNVQEYWRMVVVEQPVYYISYGVSAIASINIYTIADEDYEEAVEIYCSLIEDIDLDEGFLGNIQNAGLDGPFDEDVYEKLYDMLAA